MCKVIAIASGKGGTGKTTIAAALSSCLAVLGNEYDPKLKVLCIDFDAQLRNLDLALCMTDFTVMDFTDVISGRTDLVSACSESPKIHNLFFLTAPHDGLPNYVNESAIKKMFDNIRSSFDYCIIDCPAGIGSEFKLAHSNVDMSIIVSTGDIASIRDAGRTASAVRELGVSNIRLLVNRVKPRDLKRIKTNIDDIIDTIGVQLLGIIPEDINVFLALHKNTPLILYKKRRSAYDFLDAARRIAGDDIPLQQYKRIL